MDKAQEFLIKIQSKNKKRQLLKEKEAEYALMIQSPVMADYCTRLKSEIDFLRRELR